MDLSRITVSRWRKASRSSGNGGACIEVGQTGGAVTVRDTKQSPYGPMLAVAPDAWRALPRALKNA